MSRRDKLIARFLLAPKDFTWDELATLLGLFGYECVNNGSSHVKFHNKSTGQIISCVPKPHGGGNEVKSFYLKRIRKELEDNGDLL